MNNLSNNLLTEGENGRDCRQRRLRVTKPAPLANLESTSGLLTIRDTRLLVVFSDAGSV